MKLALCFHHADFERDAERCILELQAYITGVLAEPARRALHAASMQLNEQAHRLMPCIECTPDIGTCCYLDASRSDEEKRLRVTLDYVVTVGFSPIHKRLLRPENDYGVTDFCHADYGYARLSCEEFVAKREVLRVLENDVAHFIRARIEEPLGEVAKLLNGLGHGLMRVTDGPGLWYETGAHEEGAKRLWFAVDLNVSSAFAVPSHLTLMPYEVTDVCPELLSALDAFAAENTTTAELETAALGALGQRFVALKSASCIADVAPLAAYIERELSGHAARADAIATGFLEGAARTPNRQAAITAISALGPLARAFCAAELSLPHDFDWDAPVA